MEPLTLHLPPPHLIFLLLGFYFEGLLFGGPGGLWLFLLSELLWLDRKFTFMEPEEDVSAMPVQALPPFGKRANDKL